MDYQLEKSKFEQSIQQAFDHQDQKILDLNALNSQALSDLNATKQQLSDVSADRDRISGLYNNLSNKPAQRIGMNTHFFYKNQRNIDKIIQCLQDLGITYIRNDFDYNADTGKLLEHSLWTNTIKPALNQAKIKVRPMFYIRGKDPASSIQKLAENYPYFFDQDCEIEYGNENALRSITGGTGDVASSYDTAKLQSDGNLILAAYKQLLNYPVEQLISVTWTHYYFIQYLRSLGINADLSIHSYTDGWWNVGNQPKYKGLNALKAPQKLFGNNVVKEIGETGYLPGEKTEYKDENQVEKYIPLLKEQLATGKDIYLFELVDREGIAGREGHMGMYNVDFSPKPIVAELKKLIKA